jgi:ArsR family transcriptional regulator, arsenate/arsenite/antimonite-responsive transcriptional repressor
MPIPPDQVAATMERCTPLFFALGEPARQRILVLLTEHDELNVNQLTERLHLSRPAISHHLKVLRQAGMVGVRKAGVENFHVLTIEPAIELLAKFVAEVRDCG